MPKGGRRATSWKKGESGNIAGRPKRPEAIEAKKIVADVKAAAREHTQDALDTPGQHTNQMPQMLCPPGGAERISREKARARDRIGKRERFDRRTRTIATRGNRAARVAEVTFEGGMSVSGLMSG